MALIFKNAEEAKNAITATQQQEIAKLYEDWADEIGKKAKSYSYKTTASSVVSERQMKELQKMMKTTGQQVSNEIYSKITGNMYTIADAVVADNVKWLESFGFSSEGLNAAFNYVPDSVVRNLVTGQIYDSGWSLSKRIWGDNEQTMKDAYQIMAKGLAENKPVYQIAKDLESYVRPSEKLPWNPVLAMKNTKTGKIEYKRIYKKQVDYNAQRLARTLVQHSYQQSFIATTEKNPFITEYIWHSNGSRVCPLCLDRDGMTFQKGTLPMDHPNGMCTMEPVIAKDMVDQLANWFNSPDGTYPEIDTFAGNFGYNASKTGTLNDYLTKYGKSDKSWGAYVKSLSPIQKAEAQLLKNNEGLSWQKWYEKNIYTGTGPSANYKKKAVATVEDAFETQLKKAGFTESTMPKNFKSFNEWYMSDDVEYTWLKNVSKALGYGDDGVDVFSLEKQFNEYMAKQTIKTTTKIATKVDDAFDATKWYNSVRANDVKAMNQWTDDWLKGITSVEKDGVVRYTSNAYRDMNGYLRGFKSTTNYPDEIKACQSALSKASLPKETIVRRGSDYNMLDSVGLRNLSAADKDKAIGVIVEDKGFTSTSPASGGGFGGDIEYVIKLPKGSQAMYVDSISHFQGEEEILINCGSKYVVEGLEFNDYGDVKKIFMTLINLQ